MPGMLVAGDGRGLTACSPARLERATWICGKVFQLGGAQMLHLVGLDLEQVIHGEGLIGEGICASVLCPADLSTSSDAQVAALLRRGDPPYLY